MQTLFYRSFSLSRNKHGTKKYIGNRPVEEAKKMKCFKRLIYKQSQVFVPTVSELFAKTFHAPL